jgi:hypothetical protein
MLVDTIENEFGSNTKLISVAPTASGTALFQSALSIVRRSDLASRTIRRVVSIDNAFAISGYQTP